MHTAHILLVDDEEAIRQVLSTMLESRGYKCTALSDGLQAQEFVRKETPDVVLTDMIMPNMDGIELLVWLHEFAPQIPVVMVTHIHDFSTAIQYFRLGAFDYIPKPFEKHQLFHSIERAWQHRQLVTNDRDYRNSLQQEVERKTAELTNVPDLLTQSYDGTLDALGSALALHDNPSAEHSRRVTAYAISVAKKVPVPLPYLTVLARASFLHDIGKMAISDKILRKPGPLDDAEKLVMRARCEIGYNLLARMPFLFDAAEIVLTHGEFFDGTGYPRGLRGEAIPLGARIVSIADALDSMLSDCPYRKALPVSHAYEELRRCAGTQFDPKIVE